MPVGSISLQFAGEMILPKQADKDLSGLFRRFQLLFETYANMPRDQRLLNYQMINALMLTSYAKKAEAPEIKKRLFDLKNELIIKLANDRTYRRMLGFKYLASKNFRVLKFCDACIKKNTEAEINSHQWKYCKDCDVDRSFYNVLSVFHRFDNGSCTVFLSNDLVPRVEKLKLKNKGKLTDHAEEAKYDKYHYNVRNLDAFNLESVQKMHDMFNKSEDN